MYLVIHRTSGPQEYFRSRAAAQAEVDRLGGASAAYIDSEDEQSAIADLCGSGPSGIGPAVIYPDDTCD